MKVVLATSNVGKLREFKAYLASHSLDIIAQDQLPHFQSIEEAGLTFVENAILKARHASQLAQLPALADDSGLVVPILNGAPGIYSARYSGKGASASDNIQKLLTNLAPYPDSAQRRAYFYTVIVYMKSANDPTPLICEGIWHGFIAQAPRGNGGFGYDPIFYDPVEAAFASELSVQQKNAISHRAKALRALIKQLDEQ